MSFCSEKPKLHDFVLTRYEPVIYTRSVPNYTIYSGFCNRCGLVVKNKSIDLVLTKEQTKHLMDIHGGVIKV